VAEEENKAKDPAEENSNPEVHSKTRIKLGGISLGGSYRRYSGFDYYPYYYPYSTAFWGVTPYPVWPYADFSPPLYHPSYYRSFSRSDGMGAVKLLTSEKTAEVFLDGAVGAALLTAEQVRHSFVSDLNRGYVVVEVSAYPKVGEPIELARHHFVLKTADGAHLARPADPKTVAAILNKTAAADREVTLYPSIEIGYESGPRVYDPATGGQRGGGLSTAAGVGVGVGPSQSGASEQDRSAMEIELSEKGLPEIKVSKPLSGYLYFPVSGKKKNGFLLECNLGKEKPLLLKLLP
jgi:hypothetical protein